ncbi:MAG: O-antigen ligase family protein [Deltaproteobacteria bacterium]|nr:O-antigen ligase family protein [Deltaproteobacteria bacterium]MBW2324222.1 O-antigen ligase family protein [Deltaproteobacteria bacterium]
MTKSRLSILQELTLYGVFLTVPLFRLGTEILGSRSLTPAKILIGITLLLWLVNILINKDTATIVSLLREKANLLILIFLVVTFMSLIHARYIQDETFSEIMMRLKVLALYFLIILVIKDRRTLKFAVIAFILGSLLTTGVGLYELTTGKAFFKETIRFGTVAPKQSEGLKLTTYGKAARVQGLYSESGAHAYAMVLFTGLTLPWFFYSTSKKIKIAVGILLICYIMNIIGTGARVGWVSLGCALIVFLLLLKHRFKYTIWVIVIISVITIFLALSLMPHLPTFVRLQFTKDLSFSWRLDTYRQALEMIRDHPLMGVGPGNYLVEYHNYLRNTPGLSRVLMGWIHNSYLQVWVENGTIGFLIFVSILTSISLSLLAVYRGAIDLDMKILSLGLLVALAGFIVELSGNPIIGQEPGWMILGLSVALIIIDRAEKQKKLPVEQGRV